MNLPSLHLAEEKERTMERERDSWRKKLEFDAHILLIPGASGHFGYVYENASLLEYQRVCVLMCV